MTGLLVGALAAIPIAGPIAAAVAAIGLGIANLFGGCGQTCIQATAIANKLGDYLAQNLNAYLSAPVRYRSLQQACLNNFDTGWKSLVAACADPALGAAGERCISDRARNSCVYHSSPGGWQQQQNGGWVYVPPGANGSGSACWNYFVGFRDPIANDPDVAADPAPDLGLNIPGLTSLLPASGSGPDSGLWLAAALIAAGLLL